MSKVSLLDCPDYSSDNVRMAILKHFENLGGIEAFVSYGDNVVIKPNLICPRPSDCAAQTHPSFILELAKILLDFGAKPIVCDSPAWADAQTCVKALGIFDELKHLNVEVKQLNKSRNVLVPFANTKTGISSIILDADKVINLPKLKAHQQMVVSIAIKNMFGTVVGKRKAIWHYRRGGCADEFSKLLLGVFQTTKPTINIIDAVIAMEAQGPINGDSRELGFTLASSDAFACERVCANIIGLNVNEIPLLRCAIENGLSDIELEDIEIVGDLMDDFVVDDFIFAELSPLRFTLPRIIRSVYRQIKMLAAK